MASLECVVQQQGRHTETLNVNETENIILSLFSVLERTVQGHYYFKRDVNHAL